MNLVLTAVEVRILGCLVEKQATTPDVYPLTLNSLQTACNQKSSRDPVMALDEPEIQFELDTLIEKSLAMRHQSTRSRTAKYRHKLQNRVFQEFNFSVPELAALCVLFLRGPQTIGEICSRSARIHKFEDLDAVMVVLDKLEQYEHGPYVRMLARQSGQKEFRYTHLFCGDVEDTVQHDVEVAVSGEAEEAAAQGLQLEVDELREKLLDLETRFNEFVKQFE